MSDISDLFAKDPLSLTKEDRSKIIAKFREARANWNTTGKAKPKEKVDRKPGEVLNMDDLGDL